MLRSPFAASLPLLGPLALLACGGETVGDAARDAATTEASSDAATTDARAADGGSDAPFDAADAHVRQDGDCPDLLPATCTQGERCRLDCNECFCDLDAAAGGPWGCTTKACPPP